MTSGHVDFKVEEGWEVQDCSFKAWGKTYQFRLWDVTFRVTVIFSPNITFCFNWWMCCLQSTISIDCIYLLQHCYVIYFMKINIERSTINTVNHFSNISISIIRYNAFITLWNFKYCDNKIVSILSVHLTVDYRCLINSWQTIMAIWWV